MTLCGDNLIAGAWRAGAGAPFTVQSPLDGAPLPGTFQEAQAADVDAALGAAAEAFGAFRRTTPEQRAEFLLRIGEEIMALGDALLDRCHRETALPRERLAGERGRTVGQLRLFAQAARAGSWVEACIDTADPTRSPQPKPDLRRMLVPIGPVVVFGASNFPLAFSVAGGDTASALATGNPVIVKAHEAHPGTSELVAGAINRAREACGLPAGIFSMLQGSGHALGTLLAQHPHTCAVGLTGSLAAGRALLQAAQTRPVPIPLFAEMASVNPVFVLPDALRQRGGPIAQALCASITLGVGQFCTKPGVIFVVSGPGYEDFCTALRAAIAAVVPGSMLHGGIARGYAQGLRARRALAPVALLGAASQEADTNRTQAAACILTVTLDTFLAHPLLAEEIFGPCAIVVSVPCSADLVRAAAALPGQLTATLYATDADVVQARELLDQATARAGRIVFNGAPTGVEVTAAMQHGGPWPASSDARFTSVGTAALRRFVRPVCLQNAPAALLPPELQDANPWGIWRLVNGEPTNKTGLP